MQNANDETEKIIGETDETTLKFEPEFAENQQTKLQYSRQTDPTQLATAELRKEETADPAKEVSDENALRPNRLRFAVVCLFFALLVIDFGGLAYQYFFFDSSAVEWQTKVDENSVRIARLLNENSPLQINDEVISINDLSVDKQKEIENATIWQKPGTAFQIRIKRGDEFREFQLATIPLPFIDRFVAFLETLLLPGSFLLVGMLIFLLKPDDKMALLAALMLCGLSLGIGKDYLRDELPLLFKNIRFFLSIFTTPAAALFFHFALIFPERPRFVRRFPQIEWLLYLPVLLFVPGIMYHYLGLENWFPTDEALRLVLISFLPLSSFLFYIGGGLVMLLLNYFWANRSSRRKLNVIVGGVIAAFAPTLLFVAALMVGWIFGLKFSFDYFEWLLILILLPLLLIPVSFAYAIARHRVIPVSFIVRRSLQYLLAKNALRLLLILPVAGVVWNIASNPNRTVTEILFQNSFAFYVFIAVGVADFLLMRWRLNEWIDRRFFREQYNQERLLRELVDDVKQADSMPKLSRLVSNRIQSALHPTSLFLFYRDDEQNSDFSLGYTVSEPPESNGLTARQKAQVTATSSALKLPADSPILRFMENKRQAVEFSSSDKNENFPQPDREWLHSIGANLLVPMHGTDGKLAGFFALGEKRSEIPYTGRDKQLLETLAHQIALVHENLSLKDRVRREQRIKTEVLSRFDEGNINLLKECPRCGRCYDRNDEKCGADNSELIFTLPVERTIENRYRLEKLIGKGGMGAVYEAIDLRINRAVALKILSGASFGNREALRRFEREAQTAGRLQHRNVVTIFDYGTLSTEGAFLVMELVRGDSLKAVLKREGKLNLKTIANWFSQVLNGVEAAHKAGIVHRDLKPDNVLVSQNESGEERLCILDFGLAKLSEKELAGVTTPGTIMGTFGYMPPEQLRGEPADERSDLFAVGVMIYEALHGEKPFRGRSYQELVRAMSEDLTLQPNKPLAEFFEKALARKPENRFVSAGEMKNDLTRAIADLQN
ncbi:MAG: protein kinase [Acidobacteriota bacterium]|nr:protein kinase [Acidobacteriota bacterium]